MNLSSALLPATISMFIPSSVHLAVKAPPTFHPLPLSRNAHPDLSHPTPPPPSNVHRYAMPCHPPPMFHVSPRRHRLVSNAFLFNYLPTSISTTCAAVSAGSHVGHNVLFCFSTIVPSRVHAIPSWTLSLTRPLKIVKKLLRQVESIVSIPDLFC